MKSLLVLNIVCLGLLSCKPSANVQPPPVVAKTDFTLTCLRLADLEARLRDAVSNDKNRRLKTVTDALASVLDTGDLRNRLQTELGTLVVLRDIDLWRDPKRAPTAICLASFSKNMTFGSRRGGPHSVKGAAITFQGAEFCLLEDLPTHEGLILPADVKSLDAKSGCFDSNLYLFVNL